MKRNGKAVLALGVLAAAVIAAGGAAFTNSNSLPQTTTAGYGSSTVTGATATSIVYNPSPDGTTIQSVTIMLNGPPAGGTPEYPIYTDYSNGYTVKGGFSRGPGGVDGQGQPIPPPSDDLTTCDVAPHAANSLNTNVVTCNFTGINTWETSSFHLLVTNN